MIAILLGTGLFLYYYLNVTTGNEFKAGNMPNQMLANADIGPVKLRGGLGNYGRDPMSRAQPILLTTGITGGSNNAWRNQIDHKVAADFFTNKKWVKAMQQELYDRAHHFYTVSYQKNILQTPSFGSPLVLSISPSFPSYIEG